MCARRRGRSPKSSAPRTTPIISMSKLIRRRRPTRRTSERAKGDVKMKSVQCLLLGAAVALLVYPGRAADGGDAPVFSGLWGRDSLNLESPPSGPGPVVNLTYTAEGVMDMSRLVGDYNSPILKPEAAAILKKRGEASLAGESV